MLLPLPLRGMSLLSVHVCLCVCYIYVHLCVRAYPSVSMSSQVSSSATLFIPLLPNLSLNQNLIIAANAAGQQVPVCRYGVTGMHMLSFYVHAGDMAPGPLTCMANMLTH